MPVRPLSEAALAQLRAHAWQGNVRELENCIHRAVLLAEGDEIGPQAIMLQGAAVGGRNSGHQGAETKRALVGRTVAEAERHLILDTLRHTLGNRTHAASILGISLRTLRNRLHQYGDAGCRFRRRAVAAATPGGTPPDHGPERSCLGSRPLLLQRSWPERQRGAGHEHAGSDTGDRTARLRR